MPTNRSDPIVQVGHPVLRQKAQEIPLADIPTPRIQAIIQRMREVLAAEPHGAALAAPQIGVPLRIFVVSHRILSEQDQQSSVDMVCINPRIIKQARKKVRMDEGCLSVRGVYGYTRRSPQVTIEAYNERGERFVRGAGGILAQAFQHEIDHLNGILFIDHAEELWEVSEDSEGAASPEEPPSSSNTS